MAFNESGEETSGLLDDVRPPLIRASHAKRFVNYLIDLVIFNILLVILLIIAANFYPPMQQWMEKTAETGNFSYTEQLLVIVVYGTYMFILEALLKGKSVGKYVTGTRAVKQDGNAISVRDAQLRGLFRMIPFHPLSALGMPCYPWHDRWSKTFVIDEKASGYALKP